MINISSYLLLYGWKKTIQKVLPRHSHSMLESSPVTTTLHWLVRMGVELEQIEQVGALVREKAWNSFLQNILSKIVGNSNHISSTVCLTNWRASEFPYPKNQKNQSKNNLEEHCNLSNATKSFFRRVLFTYFLWTDKRNSWER